MTKLLIVESPNKAETIQNILGSDYRVLASYGHIRDLPARELGMDESTFELQYELGDRAKPVVSKLRSALAECDSVLLATDPDREGEAISWHLKEALRLREGSYRRVTFNAINERAIRDAIASPREIDDNLVHAQEARRALDRLVGYKVSPVLWDSLGSVSAGRVQSPAVRAVVEREAEIKAFRVTNHYGARAVFAGGQWSAEWITAPHITDGGDYILDRGPAEKAASFRSFSVVSSETAPKRKQPPAPFTTSTLLQAASSALKFSPEKTAKLAQALFEGERGSDHGHISYHRTDSRNFSPETVAEIRAYAQGQGLPLPEKPRTWKEKGDAQGAHEAIRPTDLSVEVAGSNDDERALYKLIRERAIACQLADAVYSVTSVELSAVDAPDFTFKASGRVLVEPGYLALGAGEAPEDEPEDEKEASGKVPPMQPGQHITADSAEVLAKATRPPSRFTEASLVKRLEDLGIGRPSTYPAIMSNIKAKGYVEIDKRFLVPTALGVDLIGALKAGGFAFIDYAFTRSMEERLDSIAAGDGSYFSLVSEVASQLADDVAAVVDGGKLKPRYACSQCGKAMRRVRSKQSGEVFWSCSGFADGCKHAMDDKDGEPVPRKSHPCPDCSKPMYRRKGQYGYYWGCSGYGDGCKCIVTDDKGKPGAKKQPAVLSEHSCTKCSKPLIRRRGMTKPKTVKGKKYPAKPYDFYACSGYPACEATYETGSDGLPVLSG